MRKWNLVQKNGKIRETYENTDGSRILLVTGDETPEFEQYLRVCIPGKGKLSTKISKWWFDKTVNILPNAYCSVKNEFTTLSIEDRVALGTEDMDNVLPELWVKMLPVEVVVRGFVTHSMWERRPEGPKRYKGISLPSGLVYGAKLPSTLFAPALKSPPMDKRKDWDFDGLVDFFTRYGILKSEERAEIIRDYSLKLFDFASSELLHKGLILAETKFEFGINPATGNIILADELLTPEVSTFWDINNYRVGMPEMAIITQPIHDWIKAHPDQLVPNELLEDAGIAYDQLATRICH